MDTKKALIKSAACWEQLAAEDEAAALWDRTRGADMSAPGQSAGDHRARAARRAATALRLEAATGRPHCTLCLESHPNHLHTHQL